MSEQHFNPQYDLEQRTFEFALSIRSTIKTLPYSISNKEDSTQLIRSSGSIGANYLEANDALSKKDFIYRLRISRKEAKESEYWLRLIISSNKLSDNTSLIALLKEASEIRKILSAIINKSSA